MRILILLSGGVDSNYCVLRNSKIGYKKIYCLYIKIWQNNCKYKDNINTILNLKKKIKFKIIFLNLEKEYYKNVFKPFIKLYKNGYTPNCDIFCNEKIKFKYLNYITKIKKIKKIYTGHYSKIYKNKLFCSKDKNKDQSFFLCRVIFKNINFPLGNFLKKDIFFLINFINIKFIKSSRGICFIERNINDIFKNEERIFAKIKYNNVIIGYCSFLKTIGQKIFINNKKYYIYNKIRKKKILNVCKSINSSLLYTKLFCINKFFLRKKINLFTIRNVYIKIRNTSILNKAFIFFYINKIYINFVNIKKNISVGQIISVYDENKMLILSGTIKYIYNKGFVNF